MNEDIETVVSDDTAGDENNVDVAEASESLALENTEAIESTNTVEVVEVDATAFTPVQTTCFALGVFAFLMFIYFICQRGSYNGRNS